MQTPTSGDDRPHGFYRLVIPLMIAELVAALELTMMYAAMRGLVADFGGASRAGWLITAFILSSAAGAALFGRLGDILGRRNVLLWVLALSTLGSLIGSISKDLGWLIAGRTLQGLVGAIVPLCFGMIRERVSLSRVSFGIGMISSSVTIASSSGLVIGGLIIDFSDWSMIFKVSMGLGIIAFATVMIFIDKDKPADSAGLTEDLLGGLLFIPAVVSLLLGINNAAKHGILETASLVWLGGAILFMAAWVWRELRVANPLLDVRMLARPEVIWPNILMIFIALGAYQGGQLMALFGQQPLSTGVGLGLTATSAGFLLFPGNILAGLATPFAGAAINRYGPRRVASLGCLCIFLPFVILAFCNSNALVVIALLIVQAVGLGIVYVTMPVVLVYATPEGRASEATGMLQVIRSTAMAIGAQTVATLLSAGSGHGGGAGLHNLPTPGAYQTAFLYVAGTTLIAMLVCQRFPGTLSNSTKDEAPT